MEFWTLLANGLLRCEVCPRQCQLSDQQAGFCSVRKRCGERIELISYGLTSNPSIDPVEKKPLYHFSPRARVLSFGSSGCNLACKFCQNSALVKSSSFLEGAVSLSPERVVSMAKEYNCLGVAFTYNEPAVAVEYVADCAKLCHQHGIKTVAVTNGYIQGDARSVFFHDIDAVNVDLKAFSDDFYQRLCSGSLQPVLETLRYLVHETSVWVEITNLVIPGENDQPQQISALSEWIVDELGAHIPLHFSAFFPSFKMKDKPPCSVEVLQSAREIALDKGLQYVYLGNVRHQYGATTFCPSCGKPLIERAGFEILSNSLSVDGCCCRCGFAIAGVWKPGD